MYERKSRLSGWKRERLIEHFVAGTTAQAAANLLTNPALDPIGKIPEFKFCAARVEKAKPTA